MLAREGCRPDFEGVDVDRHECSDVHVCLDSETDGALEHLAKEKTLVLVYDVHQEMIVKGKGIKLRDLSGLLANPLDLIYDDIISILEFLGHWHFE